MGTSTTRSCLTGPICSAILAKSSTPKSEKSSTPKSETCCRPRSRPRMLSAAFQSDGIRHRRIKVRLFFWLSEPVSNATLNAVLTQNGAELRGTAALYSRSRHPRRSQSTPETEGLADRVEVSDRVASTPSQSGCTTVDRRSIVVLRGRNARACRHLGASGAAESSIHRGPADLELADATLRPS